MSRRTLIRGGCVLTLGQRMPNLPLGDVLVEDGRIAEVATRIRARVDETIDASEAIVMPGFVDTHRHTWKSLLRNLGEEGSQAGPQAALESHGRHYRPDDVYAATLIGLLGAAEAGITTVVDWSDIQASDEHSDAALQAHADAGLRTVFVHAAPRSAAGDGASGLPRLADRAPDLTTIAHGSGDPDPTELDRTARDWASARRLGMRIHAHAGRSLAEAGMVADLASRGILGPDVTLVHCTRLDDGDLDAVASSGTSVSLTPSTEMAGGLGSPPLQKLIDRGIRPGLGIDDELMAPGDMFAQMRAANAIQHATSFDRKLAGKAGIPSLLTTRDVIRYATIDGARAVGLADATGSLEPGKQADILVLGTDRPNIHPINDPIGAVVWGMDTSNVGWVLVAGEVLVRRGALTADTERARALAVEARRRIGEAVGIMAPAGPAGGTA